MYMFRILSGYPLWARILKGTGAQMFSQVVQIFIRLAEVPLLLAFWGAQLYGEWLIIATIPAYLSISDGGFAGAACRDMTIKNSAGDRQGALAIFQSTWLLLLLISCGIGMLTIGFIQISPLKSWLSFTLMQTYDIKAVLLILIVYVFIGFQGGLLTGGFWIVGRYPAAMYLSALSQLFEFIGFSAAVVFGGGPIQAAAGYLAGRALGLCLMWIGQRRASPWLRHGFSHASFSEIRRLAAPAFASLSFPLGNALNIQGIRMVVGLVLGPAAVALFAPLRTLSNLVLQPRVVINRLIEPEMAMAFGAENSKLFQRFFIRSCQLSLSGCFVACFFVGIGAHWLFPVWTGGKMLMQWPTFILLLVGVLFNSLWYTALMVPYATNRHKSIAIFYSAIYGVIALLLSYIGATTMGLIGVALALLCVEAAMAIIVIRVSLQLAQMNVSKWSNATFSFPFKNHIKTAV